MNEHGLSLLVTSNLVRHGMTVLYKDFGRSELSKIERRLQEKYDMNLSSVILSLSKTRDIMIEFFGETEVSAFENKISYMTKMFQSMLRVPPEEFFMISDDNLTQQILKTLSDKQKAALISAFDTSQTIQNVLKSIDFASTTAYRKINEIIDDGFIIFRGHDLNQQGGYGKHGMMYSTWFDIKIIMENGKMAVYSRVKNDRLRPIKLD